MAMKSVGWIGDFHVQTSRVEMEKENECGGEAIDNYALCGTFWTSTTIKLMRRAGGL